MKYLLFIYMPIWVILTISECNKDYKNMLSSYRIGCAVIELPWERNPFLIML